MSSSTNYITAFSQEDAKPHTDYNNTHKDIAERHRNFILVFQSLAQLRQLTKDITRLGSNTLPHLAFVIPTLRQLINDEPLPMSHLRIIDEATRAVIQQDFENNINCLCDICALMLKQLPGVSPEPEINLANKIANSYLANEAPTIPNTPHENTTPIPIPAPSSIIAPTPIHATPIKEDDMDSDKENFVPNHLDDLDKEVYRLIQYMRFQPHFKGVTAFNVPEGYTTFIARGEKDENHWMNILNRLMIKKGKDGKYKGLNVCFANLGTPNIPHFIAKLPFAHYLIRPIKHNVLAEVTDV